MNRSLLKSAREKGLVCAVDEEAFGLADLTVLRATGRDAARFLHSQLTNEVEGLELGRGNLNARVSRTGHLEHVFSLHRSGAEEFLLIGRPRPRTSSPESRSLPFRRQSGSYC